jgi:hypothetical protein
MALFGGDALSSSIENVEPTCSALAQPIPTGIGGEECAPVKYVPGASPVNADHSGAPGTIQPCKCSCAVQRLSGNGPTFCS